MLKLWKNTLRAVSLVLVLALLSACSAEVATPSPTPSLQASPAAEPTAGPTPAITPEPSPTPQDTAAPSASSGTLPEAGTARYLKDGALYSCPHGETGLCDACVENGAVPLPDSGRLDAIVSFLTADSRLTGSEFCETCAQFIKSALAECGYDAYFLEVSTENTGYVFSGENTAVVNGETVALDYVLGSAQSEVTGKAVFCGTGYPLPADIQGAVLIANGTGTLLVISELNAGAPAAVILLGADETEAKKVPTYWPGAIVLSAMDEGAMSSVSEGDELTVKSTGNGPFESANVVAELNPDAENTVVFCAHYDSVNNTPGACDDAAGVAVLLELARTAKGLNVKDHVVFLFTTGEEQGLLGSNVYTRSLTAGEKKSVLAVYALDMFADASQDPPEIYTCNGKSNAATAALLSACGRFGLSAPVSGTETRSDHASFYRLGMPAALFAQGVSDAIYHTPNDTADKLSYDYMDLVFAYAAAALIARS